jgi:predicted RNA-binding Zn-ribbon protein involved in translation (DUF1610 family)
VTTIKGSCPDCGEVEMTDRDVTLLICSNNTPLSYYAFDCPSCSEQVRKPADDHVISLLMSGGVRVQVQVWTVPAEALEPKTGAALTRDDELDFALAIRDAADVISHLAAEVGE